MCFYLSLSTLSYQRGWARYICSGSSEPLTIGVTTERKRQGMVTEVTLCPCEDPRPIGGSVPHLRLCGPGGDANEPWCPCEAWEVKANVDSGPKFGSVQNIYACVSGKGRRTKMFWLVSKAVS